MQYLLLNGWFGSLLQSCCPAFFFGLTRRLQYDFPCSRSPKWRLTGLSLRTPIIPGQDRHQTHQLKGSWNLPDMAADYFSGTGKSKIKEVGEGFQNNKFLSNINYCLVCIGWHPYLEIKNIFLLELSLSCVCIYRYVSKPWKGVGGMVGVKTYQWLQHRAMQFLWGKGHCFVTEHRIPSSRELASQDFAGSRCWGKPFLLYKFMAVWLGKWQCLLWLL